MNDEYQFWLVWNPQGGQPTVKHPTPQKAAVEAERLAQANPGQSFYILEAIQARRVDSMQRVYLLPAHEAPAPF